MPEFIILVFEKIILANRSQYNSISAHTTRLTERSGAERMERTTRSGESEMSKATREAKRRENARITPPHNPDLI